MTVLREEKGKNITKDYKDITIILILEFNEQEPQSSAMHFLQKNIFIQFII